jgi:hypothetical protein
MQNRKISETVALLALWSTLLFSVSCLSFVPWGSGWRFLFFITLPLCVFTLCIQLKRGRTIKDVSRDFFFFLRPFLPLLAALLVILLLYSKNADHFGVRLSVIVRVLLAAGFCYSVLRAVRPLKFSWVYVACALGSSLAFFDVCFTAVTHWNSPIRLRDLVNPYCTIYARCVALLAGVAFFGIFSEDLRKKFRIFCLVGSLLGFVTAIGLLETRSVLLTLPFAAGCAFWYGAKRRRVKLNWKIVAGLLIALGILVFSLSGRFLDGARQVAWFQSPAEVISLLHKIDEDKPLSKEEVRMHREINTNMGARVAVWSLASEIVPPKIWFGNGKGSVDSFVDSKKVFQYSGDILPHFHSDYVQALVIGGLLLLAGLVLTEIWLFIAGLGSGILTFMNLSMLSFGIVDYGFFETKALTVYVMLYALVLLARSANKSAQ